MMPSIFRPLVPLLLAALLPAGLQGAEKRIPWTTSAIRGTPEPPLPFRVERAFPKLTFEQPNEVATIPGSDRLVAIETAGKIFSFPDDEAVEKADLFGDMQAFDSEVGQCYSIAFHPRFAENRLVYVWVLRNGHGKQNTEDGTRIVQFRVTTENPPRLDLASGKVVFVARRRTQWRQRALRPGRDALHFHRRRRNGRSAGWSRERAGHHARAFQRAAH
jgi:hypothetical protein